MERRALLAATGTAAVGLAGCLDRLGDDDDSGNPDDSDGPDTPEGTATGDDTEDTDDQADSDAPADAEWSHGVGGSVNAVAAGRVFFIETFGDDTGGDGAFAALDAETGEHSWSYGSSHGYSAFTDPAVADALYVGYGDDAIGSGSGELYALEFDGTERWTFDTGSVYDRPRLREGTVYVGSDDGVIRAIDADEGTLEWRFEVATDESGGPPDPSVLAVDDDAVYVGGEELVALDRSDGEERWRFGDEDASIRTAFVHDGVAYVRDWDTVSAVVDGEAEWSRTFDPRPHLNVTDDGRLFARSGDAVVRIDPADGEDRWAFDGVEYGPWAVAGDSVYVAGGDVVHSVDASDGELRGKETVGDGDIGRIRVAEDADADHAVFVEEANRAIHRVSPDGEVTWSEQVPGDVLGYVVDDLVFVGTHEGVHAFDPR